MTTRRSGLPALMIGLWALVLVGAVVFLSVGGGRTPASAPTGTSVVSEVQQIARRDEPVVVTPAQARAESLADLDRTYPAARRRDDAELLELFGLVPPHTDLRKVSGDVSGGEVAGYYDTKKKRLAVVSGPASANRALTEITLSHELNHALEDQRFKIHDPSPSGADDGASAYTALVEGSATSVMDDYAKRYIAPGSLLASAFTDTSTPASVPPYIQRSLEFSYTAGEKFVNELRRVAHGWKLVNYALTHRRPASTEQILHPEKYLADERPLPVSIGPLGLDPGFKRVSRGSIGEVDTDELLRIGNPLPDAQRAAAGWGGGRYEMWIDRSKARGCDDPCRRADVLVVRWRWDTPADAHEFDKALRRYAEKNGVAGGTAVLSSNDASTLALAPTRAEAQRVAAAASGLATG
jgi:hypothetical protein